MTRKKVTIIIIIALALALPIIAIMFSIIALVNNAKTNSQLLILKTENSQLEYRLAKLEELSEMEEMEDKLQDLEESIQKTDRSEEPEATNVDAEENYNNANGKSEDTQKSLTELIESNNPNDWREAAANTETTEEQLKVIAVKLARYCKLATLYQNEVLQLEITEVIGTNPNTTKLVMEEIKASMFQSVKETAQSWIDNH